MIWGIDISIGWSLTYCTELEQAEMYQLGRSHISSNFFLSDEGYNVEAFTDPQEALKRFVQLSGAFSSYYRLVLLDIRMPRLNGLQLFNTIKTLSPDTKILFCSALDTAKELVSILHDANYDCIIRKPVEREYFINKINSALNNSTVHFESLSA